MNHTPTDTITSHVRRFVVACLTLAVLLFAVPAALIVAARQRFGASHPMAGVAHPTEWRLDSVLNALTSPLSDVAVADTIIRLSITTIWLALAVVTVSIALELVHVVRHGGLSMPTARGFGWAQRIARVVAAGLLALTPIMSPRLALAANTAAPSDFARTLISVDQPPADVAPATHASDVPTTEADEQTDRMAERVHTVERGESVYSIAEHAAGGDPARTARLADAILDANLGNEMVGGGRFTNPAYIEIGWRLSIPSLAPTDRVPDQPMTPVPTPASDSPVTSTGDSPAVHVVEAGETLAEIAEEHLGDADDWKTLWADNSGDDMGGGRTFDDPNLILPGWELDVRRHDTAPADVPPTSDIGDIVDIGETSEATVVPPIVELESDAAPATPLPSVVDRIAPTDTASTPPTVPDVRTATPAESPAPELDRPIETPVRASVPTSAGVENTAPSGGTATVGEGQQVEASTDDAASTIGFSHAAFLAGGLAALLAARRRGQLRRSRSRSHVPRPAANLVAAERSIQSLDAAQRTTRLDIGVRAAAHGLLDTDAQIAVVFVEPSGELGFRLTASAPMPAPFVGADQDWMLPADTPLESLGSVARLIGMPCLGLVQLGTAGSADVLVDLEALGTLAIEQPSATTIATTASPADDVLTAIAAGLAASPFAEAAHVITVSLATDVLLGHRNAHQASTVSAGFEMAASIVGSTASNADTTFSLRARRTGGEIWEPALVLLQHDDTTAETGGMNVVARRLDPGHGVGIVGVVSQGGWEHARARLVPGDSHWVLSTFGSDIELSPVGLDATDVNDLAQLVEHASCELPATPDVAAELGEATALELGASPATESAPFVPMPHEIVVRLLGGVDVIDRDGRHGDFERSKTVELIAWLATHRERSTRAAARTALWDLDVRDATFANVVSEARRALGRLVAPDADDEWVARTLTEQLPLHDLVVTDAQLVRERLDHARLQSPADAVDTLRGAAEMIRDMPFSGTGYLWPDAEGITSNLVLLATSVTTELAEHALTLGDTELVFWATGRGLLVLPGHEELIGLRMQAHARSGDLAGVRVEWESYERVLIGDAWSDGEPAPKLVALRRELLASSA